MLLLLFAYLREMSSTGSTFSGVWESVAAGAGAAIIIVCELGLFGSVGYYAVADRLGSSGCTHAARPGSMGSSVCPATIIPDTGSLQCALCLGMTNLL